MRYAWFALLRLELLATYPNTIELIIVAIMTIIIFDEFSSMLNEFRALEDYTSSYLRDYEVMAATISSEGYYSQVAIRMV